MSIKSNDNKIIDIQGILLTSISSMILLSILSMIIRLTYYDIGEAISNIQCMILLNLGFEDGFIYETLISINSPTIVILVKYLLVPIACITISNFKFMNSYIEDKSLIIINSALVGLIYGALMLILNIYVVSINKWDLTDLDFNFLNLFINSVVLGFVVTFIVSTLKSNMKNT